MTNLNEQDWQKLTEELEAIEIPKEALHQARVKTVHQHRLTKEEKAPSVFSRQCSCYCTAAVCDVDSRFPCVCTGCC